MKIPRSLLKQMIREELSAHIGSLLHEKQGASPDTEDAESGKQDQEKDDKTALKPHQDPDNTATKPKGDKPGASAKPAGDDPADKGLEKQAAGEEEPSDDADAEDDEAGPEQTDKVSDELVGKTVQSITANPKSKLMPGATEIVIQFDQIPEPLKILVTKTGAIKYYFKGLHNEI